MAKVTVVVPTYNAAPYIGQTLESVDRSAHEEWRLIVVDDGSTDGTQGVVAGVRARPRISAASTPRAERPRTRRATPASTWPTTTPSTSSSSTTTTGCTTPRSSVLVEALRRHAGRPSRLRARRRVLGVARQSRIGGPERGVRVRTVPVSGLSVSSSPSTSRPGSTRSCSGRASRRPAKGSFGRASCGRVGGFDPATAWSDDWDLWLRLAADRSLVFRPEFVMSKRYHDANLSSGQTASPADWGGGLAVRRKLIGAPWLTDAQRAQAKAGWRHESVMVFGWARAELRHRNYKAALTTTVRAANAYRRFSRG